MSATRTDKLLSADDTPATVDFYRYVLSHPTVTLTLMGLRDVERFRRVAQALAQRSILEPDEIRQLEEYGTQMRVAGRLA